MHEADESARIDILRDKSLTNSQTEATDVAALTQALDAEQVDVAVHWLQLLLLSRTGGPPTHHNKTLKSSRVRRLKTLQNAVAQMLDDYDKHPEETGLKLRPGLAVRTGALSCELSYPQLQMFALQRLQPSSTTYNVVRALLFSDLPLDFAALQGTCDALMAKHEMLRTCFDVDTNSGGQPRQFVYPLSHFRDELGVVRVIQTELLKYTCRCSEGLLQDAELASFVAKTIDEPFDLARHAPLRVYAITCSEQESTSQWILAVVLHHIVTDAASSQLFWSDFLERYERFLHDDHVTIQGIVQNMETKTSSASHLTYRDFAVRQRSRMRSGVAAPLLQYWTQQLTEGGVPLLLKLPFDKEDPHTPDGQESTVPEATTAKGDVVVFRSSSALQKAFSDLCHSQSSSIFMGLLAVFYLLVERLSGQQDFVIGAPSSGRDAAELQDIMGYFVNTLPLRLGGKFAGDEDFKSFLKNVRKVVLGAYNNMEIPFHKVLEHLRASAHSNDDIERRWQHPLFQVMFSWEQSEDTSSTKYTELELPHQSAKFDLMLSMRYRRLNGGTERVLEGSLEYPTARFMRSTVERFSRYYLALMEQVTSSPTALVRSPAISMLSRSEREQLVSVWGMPRPPALLRPPSEFLDECLLAQVWKTPDHPALHFEGTQWTYQDLWKYSCRVTRALCMLDISGCSAELHIGLLLDRGVENVAAMIGILRLGAVFVPLDPEFPRERLRYMTRDSELQVIITQRKHAEIAAFVSSRESEEELAPRVLNYEDVDRLTSSSDGCARDDEFDSESRLLKRQKLDPDTATAYILYTSGSTGDPKGVVVPHAALMTTLWWTVRTYEVTSSDVFLQSTSTTLDGSLSQLFSPLLVGGSARITRPKGLHDLQYMRNVLLEAPHISFCVFVPSYFSLIVDYMSENGDTFPASIKHVILAGEAFPIELARQFYKKHPACSTFSDASRTGDAERVKSFQGLHSVPIGKPIDEHPVVVLDAQRRLVPVNVPGELYIGGAGVARGYWRRPELTENSFVLHKKLEEIASLAQKRTRRWYKTGDLVKWLPSGELVFLGRTDAQVKLHGMRVELQEVRNILLRSSSIKAAEVLSVPQLTSPGQKQQQMSSTLVAFVMPAESIDELSVRDGYLTELRAYLDQHLPLHMVPQSIQVVSSWPRTPNGKIDLRTLASWAGSNSTDSRPGEQKKESTITVQLATDILRQVWMQALELQPVDGDQDMDDKLEANLMSKSFFELGGDSLAAIRAIALAQARGLSLALEQFFRTSSLPEMARRAAASMVDLRQWTSETLVPLNWPTAKNTRTVFLFHDADGTVWNLLELARQLPLAVVGVQATNSQFSSLEELAKFYWNSIRTRQNEGPYALGGFSFGCRVAHEVARLAVREGHELVPLILLDGLPFEMPSSKQVTEEEATATRLRIEQYTNEAFGDALLRPLGDNYIHFCAMEEMYQPYTTAEVETACSSSQPPVWLQADLYMTQRWSADISLYRALGIDITAVSTISDCTHLTMLRHPSVDVVARQIRQHIATRITTCSEMQGPFHINERL
ncbi:Thioesterase domain [Phytophthora infestans]|uniref:Thioesterase domain n=1 Tax=Phytophthora infestans TaxID=4787 RepID=A0A833S539_PHYIN|nr:Thioesterase domain [Phytophthora infestans]